jgi:SNF2-related domain/Helicase conserved C-terminal domain
MSALIHVSERARAIVMNPANPELLFTLIPGVRQVPMAGHNLVAVPHTLDAVAVLRNLGAMVPSPILHHYSWPGRFPPMQAQRETSAFLTLNRRAFVLNDMGCVDCDTEYLSPTGWVRIADYQGGQVAQYHPDTGAAEFVDPTEFVKRPCASMWRVAGPGVDQMLSPEHRVLLYRPDGSWSVVSADAAAGMRSGAANWWLPVGEAGKGRVCIDHCTWEEATPQDGFKYCFMVPSTFLLFRRNGCVFASGNTGKTMAALWAFDYLRSIGMLRRAIIFAPLSTLEATWASEIMLGFPHLRYAVLHAERSRRLRLLDQDNDVYIINHHGVKIVADALKDRPDIDLGVIDELSVFRTPGTDLHKAMTRVMSTPSRWGWGLTGTPTPNAPTDAWAQVKLLRSDRVPGYFKAFKEQTMAQIAPFKWVPRAGSTDLVRQAMQPAIRFTRDECMDLPPTTWQYRDVEMTPEQRRAYDAMRLRLRMEHDTGTATAVNEADKAGKLIQIASGAVRDAASGEPILLPTGQRMDVLMETIEQASGKVIVFVPYVAALTQLHQELAKHWPTDLVYGETPKHERDAIFARFQHGSIEESRVLVANARVMSHGLTLTAADTVVWFAAPVSHEVFDQASHRIIRASQKRNTLVVMIRGCPVERAAYERLRNRQSMQGLLLDAVVAEREPA